jgi:hypothetical protein
MRDTSSHITPPKTIKPPRICRGAGIAAKIAYAPTRTIKE